MKKLLENLYLYEDTCHVYIIKNGEDVVCIDFGDGTVMDELDSIGVKRITDILMTHHHRDQGQGLYKAVSAGTRIWVPHVEQELFAGIDFRWQAREVDNNYNMRQDRFSLLHSIKIAGTLNDYKSYSIGGSEFFIVPTPGHTTGSISIMTQVNNKALAFTGDLIAGPGKTWSLAATQWSYNGAEGAALSVLSLLDLKERKPDILFPSHGEWMEQPIPSIDLLVERFGKLINLRKQNPRLFELKEKPYEAITPHLLKNRTSMANAYVLLSKSNKALMIDFGYDFISGIAAGSDRASRRPWLYSINKLKQDYGIEKIDVAIPTHFHDDHVAGMNLLNEIEGTEIWCAEHFSDILEHPKKYDLPCLWYDSIPVNRRLPLAERFEWEEYQFKLHPQSGHTYFAVAIEFDVDGKKVLAIGDQYENDELNYVYRNGFRIWDYIDSAKLYKEISPNLLLSGHTEPIEVTNEYLDLIYEKGKELEAIHKELLPLETIDFEAKDFASWITPYQIKAKVGESFDVEVTVLNPFNTTKPVDVNLIVPMSWQVENDCQRIYLDASQQKTIPFKVRIPINIKVRRERIAAEITIGTRRLGQHAEALVSTIEETVPSNKRRILRERDDDQTKTSI